MQQSEREGLLSFLAEAILSRRIADRPLKVAIDGRCGSGKSVLSDELGALIRSQGPQVVRPSVDGFHHPRERRYRQGEFSARGYYEDGFNYEAIVETLLRPLSGSVFPVVCREVSHDVRVELAFDAPAVNIGAQAILLFEGIFLLRRELDPWWDIKILLDVDPATALTRALARDIGAIGPSDVIQRKYEVRYERAWQIYVNAEHPESKADIVVDNTDLLRPAVIRQTQILSAQRVVHSR
jgi:uridine kinase